MYVVDGTEEDPSWEKRQTDKHNFTLSKWISKMSCTIIKYHEKMNAHGKISVGNLYKQENMWGGHTSKLWMSQAFFQTVVAEGRFGEDLLLLMLQIRT